MSYPLPYAVPIQLDQPKAPAAKAPKPPLHPLCASHRCCQTHPDFRCHPAHKWMWLSIIFVLLSSLFGFITVFVPWAQKDIAVGTRVWAAPFRTTIEDTFSKINQETVIDNDFFKDDAGAAPLTGGDTTCHNLIITAIAFVFLYVLTGVLVALFMLWLLLTLWRHPATQAMIVLGLLFLVWAFNVVSWGLWLGYAERTCLANSPIFPVRGYSYGFIMTIFASAFLLVAMFAWFKAFKAIKDFKKGTFKLKKGQVIAEPTPAPVFAPMIPMAAPSPNSPFMP